MLWSFLAGEARPLQTGEARLLQSCVGPLGLGASLLNRFRWLMHTSQRCLGPLGLKTARPPVRAGEIEKQNRTTPNAGRNGHRWGF